MTTFDPQSNDAVAHIICSEFGDLVRITTDSTDADMAFQEGHAVTTNATPEDIDEALRGLPAKDFMDDSTWQAIAPSMKALADRQENPYDRTPPTIGVNSPDMPKEIVDMRLGTLAQIYDPYVDLQSYIEVNELAFCTEHRRAANQSLFKPESWEDRYPSPGDLDLQELEEQEEMEATRNSEIMAEHRSEAAAFGDGPVGSYRQEQLGRLDEQELAYLIANHPQKPKPSTDHLYEPHPADIPY